MAFQYWHQRGGQHVRRTGFVNLTEAYHGDTVGSVSVGGIDLFHSVYEPLLFGTHQIDPGDVEGLRAILDFHGEEIAAVIVEPLVQGAAGIIPQPPGFLRAVRELCDEHEVLLICDEVATGFGRTGTMFACEQERVVPDFLCLGKGLTNGYMPLAATLTSERIYEGFLGAHEEYRTFFHGHTFTGNPLACAAAIASLDVFEQRVDAAAPAAEDAPAPRRARDPSPRWTRSPRSAAAGSWSGSTSASTTRRCASATGSRSRRAARRDRAPARRHDRADAAAGDHQGGPRPPRRDHRRLDRGGLGFCLSEREPRRGSGSRPGHADANETGDPASLPTGAGRVSTRAALVTGASTGIGKATALLLARSGYTVFAGVRRAADGEAVRTEAQGRGTSSRCCSTSPTPTRSPRRSSRSAT